MGLRVKYMFWHEKISKRRIWAMKTYLKCWEITGKKKSFTAGGRGAGRELKHSSEIPKMPVKI